MAKQKKGFKVVFRRSSIRTKIVVLVAVVLSLATLVMLSVTLASEKEKAEELRQQAVELELDKSRLEQYIRELGTMEAVIRIAREELGLIEPGSIVIQPE